MRAPFLCLWASFLGLTVVDENASLHFTRNITVRWQQHIYNVRAREMDIPCVHLASRSLT